MWCQEEPRNMGVWRWIYGRFLDLGSRLKYAGRLRNASPGGGIAEAPCRGTEAAGGRSFGVANK